MASDILSTSPDGRYQVLTDAWDPRMSIWLYPPEIFDLTTKQVIFKVRDNSWSLDDSEWESDSIIRVSLLHYPDIPPGMGVDIRINCANKTARVGSDSEIELQVLHETLKSTLELHRQSM